MEIKDLLNDLINSAQAELDQNGQPENFDLEDFIYTLEEYWSELDDIGEFDHNDLNQYSDEDDY